MIDMREVAKQIIETEMPKEAIDSLRNKFYEIMRENKIFYGEKEDNGSLTYANFEWSACEIIFAQRITNDFTWSIIDSVPEDIFYDKSKGD